MSRALLGRSNLKRCSAGLSDQTLRIRALSNKQTASTQATPAQDVVHPALEVAQRSSISEFSSTDYASYTTSIPPTTAQLSYANKYFYTSEPKFLLGLAKFRALPMSNVPEVAFLGRSNVGKSSLLNALLHRNNAKLAHVSSRPGRTREMNAYGVHGAGWVAGQELLDDGSRPRIWSGRGGLVVLDMPGYGKASRNEWGTEIEKYLVGRKQLRRTFVLIDGEHGVKRSDIELLEILRFNGITHQIVLSKIDKVLLPSGKATIDAMNRNLGKLQGIFEEVKRKIMAKERRGVAALNDMLTTSAEVDVPFASGNKLGVDVLRWEVLSAAGLASDPTGKLLKVEYTIGQDSSDGPWATAEPQY